MKRLLRRPQKLIRKKRLRAIGFAVISSMLICACLLGLNRITQWRHQKALEKDTSAALEQTTDQLIRSFTSRRGTLTFIRDILNTQPSQTDAQFSAIGLSATQHTRHMLGTGMVHGTQLTKWWYTPQTLDRSEFKNLHKAIQQRCKLKGVWTVPSTLVAWVRPDKPILIMLEPLSTPKLNESAVVGVFDLSQLLNDFFSTGLPQLNPVRILEDDHVLYQDSRWHDPASDEGDSLVSAQPIHMDSVRWQVQMQPGKSEVLQALSWITILIVSLSVICGFGLLSAVWILTSRTWTLQNAVRRRTSALRKTSARLRQLATTDDLTGLYNRRYFMNRWEIECTRAQRYKRPLACLMIDLNKFKQVNDTLGHDVGDQVLRTAAHTLSETLRQTDILARYGGDEFIIALPETPLEQAEYVADKLRQIELPIKGFAASEAVTFSVGLASNATIKTHPDHLIKAADESLYEQKRLRKTLELA